MKYTVEQVQKVIAEKITGKIIPRHTDRGHYYEIASTGELLASATTINCLDKPHLVPWAVGLAIDFLEIPGNFERLKGPERESIIKAAKLMYTDIRDEAGSIGGAAHKIVEEFEMEWLKTGKKPESILSFIPEGSRPQVIGACRAAEQAFNKYGWTPVALELLVGVSKVGAGTLDLIVLNKKGELELVDWKTSNNVTDFYNCQVSVYKHLFEKMSGLKVKRAKIVKLDKWSDKIKVYNVVDTKLGLKAFKSISDTYKWLNNGVEKLQEDKVIIRI
jgi:hypothetical protein